MFGPWKSFASMLGEGAAYGWAGALATGAVGFAANRIARNSQLAKEQEAYLQHQRNHFSDKAAWAKLRGGIIACKMAYAAFRALALAYPGHFAIRHPDLTVIRRVLLQIKRTLPDSRLARTDVAVEDEIHIQLEALDLGVIELAVSIEEFMSRYPSAADRPSYEGVAEFVRIIHAAKYLKDMADEAGDLIDNLRPRLDDGRDLPTPADLNAHATSAKS